MRDPDFAERFAAKTSQRKKRRYLARSPQELFFGNDGLAANPTFSQELIPGSGWWIDVNLSLASIERVIALACEVAGLEMGKDIKITLKQ